MKLLLPVFTSLNLQKFFKTFGRKLELNQSLFGQDGFDGVEFDAYTTRLFDGNWNVDIARLNRLSKSFKNIYTVHACFESPFEIKPLLTFKKLNLAERGGAMETAIRRHIELVELLLKNENRPVAPEKPLLIFHPGCCEKTADRVKALENIVHNLLLAIDCAGGKPVTIGLENLPYTAGETTTESYPYRHLGTSVEDFEFIFQNANLKKNLQIVLDIGHSNVTGNTGMFIKKFRGKIRHTHLSWNDGRWDQSRPLPAKEDEDYPRMRDALRLLFDPREGGRCETATIEIWPVYPADFFPLLKHVPFLRKHRIKKDDGGSMREIIASMETVKKLIENK